MVNVDEVKKAKSQIVQGALTIWNERLTALVNAGNLRGALDQLLAPIEGIADNCGCGNNCGCLEPGSERVGQTAGTAGRG